MHYVIGKYKKNYANWTFIRHEDISKDPVNGFKELFHTLNLEYTDNVDREIKLHSDISNKDVVEQKEESLRRNSKKIVTNWRNRLSEDEINRIRIGTKDISKEFYSEHEW